MNVKVNALLWVQKFSYYASRDASIVPQHPTQNKSLEYIKFVAEKGSHIFPTCKITGSCLDQNQSFCPPIPHICLLFF